WARVASACARTKAATMSRKLGKLLIGRLLRLILQSPPFIAVTAGAFMPIKLSENFRAVFYAPFYATHALGFYASEGVEVDLLNSPAPAAAAAGLLDGSIDISWGGPMRVMKARDEDPGSPMVCFCEVAARDPFFLVGKGDPAAFRPADLPRLKIGTVS